MHGQLSGHINGPRPDSTDRSDGAMKLGQSAEYVTREMNDVSTYLGTVV